MYGIELIILIVAVALVFDFINGFHDAANSVATIVSTGALSPKWATIWAAFFNFIAFLFFGVHVANTIGTGIVEPSMVDPYLILGALVGAIGWNLVTWYYGLPSSSSHALIGGLAGAAVAKGGFGALTGSGFIKVGIAIVLSPVLGFTMAYLGMLLSRRLSRNAHPEKVGKLFKALQFVSASLYSLGHGGNDAQKTMGIIAVLLFSTGYLGSTFEVPFWVVLACHAAIGLGTLYGGWRIVKTMGEKITTLKPIGGFCAETSGAITLFMATGLGMPVSTTHTITSSIVGVGAADGLSAVNWDVMKRIVWAWVLTIPAAAAIAAGAYWVVTLSHFSDLFTR